MKRGIHELVMVGALAALAGCSSAMPSAPPISPTSVQMRDYTDARKKVVETLKASRITAKVQLCASGSGETTFTFKGKGKGHVRGKVVAKGEWSFSSIGGQTLWTFSETFKIKGKADGTITGSGTDNIATCKTFGPVTNNKDLAYHLGKLSGFATTNVMKNGARLLQQMH